MYLSNAIENVHTKDVIFVRDIKQHSSALANNPTIWNDKIVGCHHLM